MRNQREWYWPQAVQPGCGNALLRGCAEVDGSSCLDIETKALVNCRLEPCQNRVRTNSHCTICLARVAWLTLRRHCNDAANQKNLLDASSPRVLLMIRGCTGSSCADSTLQPLFSLPPHPQRYDSSTGRTAKINAKRVLSLMDCTERPPETAALSPMT